MAGAASIAVVGSANMDLVVRVERIPAPGETVLGDDFRPSPGGKGANQAVAAARMGGDVWFVGCVGVDAFGDQLVASLEADGVHTGYLRRHLEMPSGIALIGVDASGQNAIIVAPGSNSWLSIGDLEAARPAIRRAGVVVAQMEIPLQVVERAAEMAEEEGARFLLNPAPIRHTGPLPPGLMGRAWLVTPNQHEAAAMVGADAGESPERLARRIQEQGAKRVIVTLGAEGCLVADGDALERIPAVKVTAVDTTAAGDCFMGALAAGLAEGMELLDAAHLATNAAAVSVTRRGAQPSLPSRQEAEDFAVS